MQSRDLGARSILLLLLSLGPLCSTAGADSNEPRPAALDATVSVRSDGADVQQGALRMRIDALGDDLLRVRIAPAGVYPEDASWVVPAELRAHRVSVQAWTDAQATGFRTAALSVQIERRPLRLVVANLQGQILSEDSLQEAIELHGPAFTLHKRLPATEHYFGLGDKTGPLDRRGEAFVNWDTDAFGFQESTDPIYKSIPFFIATGGAAGSYGIFLDNSWRSWFDFGRQNPEVLSFGAADGPIDYYLIYGPALKRVVERYTDLSGKAPLAPLWALGFQQSRYSYMSAAEVRGIAQRMRAERVPADVIWLDIDYQDRNRPFTTNSVTFPDLAELVRDVRRQGIRLVAITDLHIADAPGQGYEPYESGAAGDHFLRRADGSTYVGTVWPGPAVFPEFTASRTREWWGNLYAGFMAEGIVGFWNDMNEPAIFLTASKTMPPDVRHRIEEPGFAARTATHAEIHNLYGMENSRATFDGMRRLAPDERPFVMTRASFAGGQRYAVTWTGDNSSTWNHLKLSISMLLNLGLSGFSYSGADVGGFKGAPSADLLTRWMEIAAFTPVFRAHSANDSTRREPWIDGPQHTAIRRHFVEERYRLMPYLYALADENARTGAPLMRPVFYEYPDALQGPCDQSSTFLLGDRLLVAPPPNFESPAAYNICLPSGHWYDYWSGAPVERVKIVSAPGATGPAAQVVSALPSLASLPVYVRAGTILPRQPLVQSTAETPQGPLSLEIYPGDDCHGVLYADDGHTLRYERGGYLRQALRCAASAGELKVMFEARSGGFHPWWTQLQIHVHGWRGAASATLAGHEVAAQADAKSQVLTLTIADQSTPDELLIRHHP
jgi:alpha-glucosidase